jgi:hypothetical protein
MISFRPVKTRVYRGINANERFGQSIANKYIFNSKPYLGMLNLLFLEPVIEQADDQKQNMYNFMVMLRMQLEQQQRNKENNLFASRPFLYQMLEKILIRQSVYSSELKAYGNYITTLNVNRVNKNTNLSYQIPSQRAQFGRSFTALPQEQASIAKVFARIIVNPEVSIGTTAARLDHQQISQYRKPLIESIWMHRIAAHMLNKNMVPQIKQLYRTVDHTKHKQSMSSIERMIMSEHTLKQVYEFGVHHDIFPSGSQQQWYNESLSLIHNHDNGIEQIQASSWKQDVRNMDFIHNYRKSLIDTIWNNHITLRKQTLLADSQLRNMKLHQINSSQVTLFEEEVLPVVKSIVLKPADLSTLEVQKMTMHSTWLNQNSGMGVERSTTYSDPIIHKNRSMLSSVHSSRVEDVFDQSFVLERLNAHRTIENQLFEYGIEIKKPIELVNAKSTPVNEMDIVEVVKSLTVVSNRASHILTDTVTNIVRTHSSMNDSITIQDLSIIKQYKRQLAHSIWTDRMLQHSQHAIHEKQDYSTTIKLSNQRMLRRATRETSGVDMFVLSSIEDQLRINRTAITYMAEHGVLIDHTRRLDQAVQLTTPNVEQAEQTDMVDIVKSITTITNRNLARSLTHTQSIHSLSVSPSTDHVVISINSLTTIAKQYKRQLADSIWHSRMAHTQHLQSHEQLRDVSALFIPPLTTINYHNRHMLTLSNAKAIISTSASIFDQQIVQEQLITNQKAIAYILEYGMDMSKPIPLITPNAVNDHNESRAIDVVKSITSIFNRVTIETNEYIDNSLYNQPNATTSIQRLRSSEIEIKMLSKQYKRQLADSIWHSRMVHTQLIQSHEQLQDVPAQFIPRLTTINRHNRQMLTLSNTQAILSSSTSIFDQRRVQEQLITNHKAAAYILEYGMDMSKPIPLITPNAVNDHNESRVTDVVKSITSIFNRVTIETNEYNDHSLNNQPHTTLTIQRIRSDELETLFKQYKRQLADSIWLSRITASHYVQALEQSKDSIDNITRKNYRMLTRTSSTTETPVTIFNQYRIAEQLRSNERAVKYLVDHGVEISKPVQLTNLSAVNSHSSETNEIVKSVTSYFNKRSSETTRVNIDQLNQTNRVNYHMSTMESQDFVKRYKRQLSESVWLTMMNDNNDLEHISENNTIDQHRSLHQFKSLFAVSNTEKLITSSIFDHQYVINLLNSNQRAMAYMVEYGVQVSKPVEFIMPNEDNHTENNVLDIVKSLTSIVNKSSSETNISSLISNHIQSRSTTSWNRNELASRDQQLSTQYNRRLSDSVLISKMIDISQEQYNEQNLDTTSRINRRNRRILHRSISSISTEIFDNKIVEERLHANRRAMNYLMDIGASIEKPVQLVSPAPDLEPDFIQDVVKAITRIEFGNTTMTKSINKYLIQQYRRQLTESIWLKQIQEHSMNSSSSRRRTSFEEQNVNQRLYDTKDHNLNRISRTNRMVTQQSIANNVIDLFNQQVVEQRLHHHNVAIKHLQELGITMNSSADLLLPNQLRDLAQPVNDVVKAVTQIVAALPAMNKVSSNKVIPIEVLRQYRKQLTHSITSDQHESVELKLNKWLQHAVRMKVNNPIIQALHQKVSGSVFDSMLIDERIFRDMIAIRQSSNVTNHSIDQRTEAFISWLLPKTVASSNGTTALSTLVNTSSATTLTENTNRTNNRSIVRRLQLIRSQYHQMDAQSLETVRAYTSTLFSSKELDYLSHAISDAPTSLKRQLGVSHHIPSVSLMHSKVTWLQGFVEHLVKTTTFSKSNNDRLISKKIESMNKIKHQSTQPLLIVPDVDVTPLRLNQNQPVSASQPVSLIHSSPSVTLDTLNEELTYRMDQEASMDYLVPKPAAPEPSTEQVVHPVNMDIQVNQDKVVINPLDNIDMTELVDKLYSEIERKMTFERQRRGF